MESGASIRSDGWPALRHIAAAGLCVLLAACSGATYSGPEWSARVVDTETGAPIEGAIVVVRWELERYSGRFAGWLFITEAVTDADGMFHLPAWGPIKAPSVSGIETRMSPNVPEIAIFQPGYSVTDSDCCSDSGYLDSGYGSGPAVRPAWANRNVFGLRRFHGTVRQYIDALEHSLPTNGPPCAFLSTPRIFAAAVIEDQRLRSKFGVGLFDQSLALLEERAQISNCHQGVATTIAGYLK
jgi:hypothetical protein